MKRKVIRLKKKNCICLILIGLMIISSVLYFNSYNYKLRKIGYNSVEIKEIEKKELSEKDKKLILSNKYIKNIYNLLKEEIFNEEKFEYYLEFYNNFDENYDPNIIKIINEQYFKIKNLNRYIEYYKNNKEASSREVVENVNCGLDNDYYSIDNDADITKGNLILVNKYNKLNSDYVPADLVKVEKKYGYERYINKTTYEAFKKMYDDMIEEKLYIFITSPYRNYKYQKSLYDNYVSKNGKEKADMFSARAGYSEHQTGLAIDIAAKNSIYSKFVSTKEYEWMIKNCYKYGFILRYPEGKESQTGYMFESWHYRYVGIEVATYIYNSGITFDEYYEYFVK